MRRAREAQIARLAARSTAADDAAAWHIATLSARVKLGMVLREALVQLEIDPATVPMLRIADEAAQELAVTADGAEGLDASALPPVADDQCDDTSAAAFEARIDGSVERYRHESGIDFCSRVARRSARLVPRAPGKFLATRGGGNQRER
jgi:hypothetical protein